MQVGMPWKHLVPHAVEKIIQQVGGIERIKMLAGSDSNPQRWSAVDVVKGLRVCPVCPSCGSKKFRVIKNSERQVLVECLSCNKQISI